MRTAAELKDIADANGVTYEDSFSSRQMMDAIRDKLGVADPELNLDPMKAKDLKSIIDWGSDRPFEKVVAKYGSDRYVVEPKLDGARIRVIFGTTANSIPTGRRSVVTYGYLDRGPNFPHVMNLVVPELVGTVIDCEVLMPEGTSIDLGPKRGFTQGPLNTIMSVLNNNPTVAVERQQHYGWAEFHAFDILAASGESVMHLSLEDRRFLLEGALILLEAEFTKRSNALTVDLFPFKMVKQHKVTEKRLAKLIAKGFEGGMIKSLDGTYEPGKRSSDWLKVKTMSTGDFFIIGSTPGKGRNDGKVGSLKLAYMADDGELVNVAECRGFDDATCDEVTDPETGDVKQEYIGRVVEIMGQGRTKNEKIRHPHFVRFRDDKHAGDCGRDQLELFPVV